MAKYHGLTPALAVMGMLALASAPAARAQDTSAAARADTSAYRAYGSDTTGTDTAQAGQRNDSSGFKYTGPATDTALKARPGVQTGPAAGDTGSAAPGAVRQGAAAGTSDSVVCKDGSNAAQAERACKAHGGIDWAATRAALNARGSMAGQASDTSAPRDTARKAEPGTQPGADTGSTKP